MNQSLLHDLVPFRNNTIRVVVPHEVAYNLDRLQKTLANVMGRLGHPGCHSGFDIRFIQEREFVVNPKTLAVEGINAVERG